MQTVITSGTNTTDLYSHAWAYPLSMVNLSWVLFWWWRHLRLSWIPQSKLQLPTLETVDTFMCQDVGWTKQGRDCNPMIGYKKFNNQPQTINDLDFKIYKCRLEKWLINKNLYSVKKCFEEIDSYLSLRRICEASHDENVW